MDPQVGTRLRTAALALVAVTALVASACSSSSSSSSSSSAASAQTLLKQTFSAGHAIKSGVLNYDLVFTPSGSSKLQGPISLSLNGPFASRGAGQRPQENISLTLSGLGQRGTLGLVSTAANEYLTLRGVAYRLPAAALRAMQSSVSAGSAAGRSGLTAQLGADALHWLVNPSIVGTATVGATPTTHIRTGVNTTALLTDVSTLLRKVSAGGATGTTKIPSISPSTVSQIAGAVKDPTVDVWTATGDQTLRKFSLSLTYPVTGQFSTLLGGLRSAAIAMTLQYSNVNQAQTISVPTDVQPLRRLQPQLATILQEARGAFGGIGAPSAGSGSAGSGSPSTAKVQKYTHCIQSASGDVTKMQTCASLLNGG